ncbi:serine hydrolase domain-containing protein [Curtobacterium ammoniigenes]|uniref:serine hydrolase domain-containing protein n=1 Tax=Curtobacterium ammoniigenes TaxID=395387 RepID=UPI0009F86150|nr:serine hydrolase domain-containing protein [Curtobacterium ammoniigenes]
MNQEQDERATRTATDWRLSTAEAEGVDPRGVRELIDALDEHPDIEPHALIVVRHGAVVASAAWAPYALDRPQLVYSVSKSFTSTAAAFAIDEGLLDLDTPVVDCFPEYADSIAPQSRPMLVRHLLSMATGHLADMVVAFDDVEHPVRAFLAAAPERHPGSVFTYNQLATYTLATIIQRRSEQRLSDYLRPRLFDPLGIPPLGWQQQPAGVDLGFSGLFAPPEAIAKLGLLYLNNGVWRGERLLPEWWVGQASSVHIDNATPGDPNAEHDDWAQGYGFQFWRSRHGFRGDGAFGQFCLVLPEQEAVVAITAQTMDMQAELNLVWEHLLPAFGDAPLAPQDGGGEALHGLARTLSFPAGLDSPSEWSDDIAGAYTVVESDAAQVAYPTLDRVGLTHAGDGWSLTLTEHSAAPGGASRLWRVGADEWAVTEGAASGSPEVAVAVQGGGGTTAEGDRSLRIDVAFIDTPHRLMLHLDPDHRTVTPEWFTRPLDFGGVDGLGAVPAGVLRSRR